MPPEGAGGGSILPGVARARLMAKLLGEKEPQFPENDYLRQRGGVFVTLREKESGNLRGCIGTIAPTSANLIEETRRNADHAAFRDRRFRPVTAGELPGLTIEVSVLKPPERVNSVADLDPARYGTILTAGNGRRGLMLPNVPGLDTVPKQIAAIQRKAGLNPKEPVKLERFEVEKFEEEEA